MNEIVIAIIGSGALSGALATIVTSIITAVSNRNGLKSKVRKLEKDSVRLQLLFLMYNTPNETQEIMTLAQYYFEQLKANWYMSSLFDKFLKRQGLERPNWFTTGGNNE